MRPFGRRLRLCSAVPLSNLIGAALFAYGVLHLPQFDSATGGALASFGKEVVHSSPLPMFTHGILADWLIATLV